LISFSKLRPLRLGGATVSLLLLSQGANLEHAEAKVNRKIGVLNAWSSRIELKYSKLTIRVILSLFWYSAQNIPPSPEGFYSLEKGDDCVLELPVWDNYLDLHRSLFIFDLRE
jgi:hypothetical protein